MDDEDGEFWVGIIIKEENVIEVNKLFELIATDLKSAVKVIYGDKRQGEIKDSFASVDKAKNLLGYKPMVSLEDGIKKSITWYKNNR